MSYSRRPNILWIIAEQHNPHIAGFAGNQIVNTSALDHLAERSTRFDAAYCQTPLCVPSRTCTWTGKWAHHCSVWNNSSVIFPEHTTLPSLLSRHGYTTAAVGKMHFRGSEQMHGFQYRPYGDLVESRFPGHQPDPPETADGRWCNHKVGRFPFAGKTQIPESMLIDSVVTRESLSFLLEFTDTNPDEPWFFVASYSRPHFPLTSPGRYFRKYVESELQLPSLPEDYPETLHPHDRFIVNDFNLLKFSEEEQRRALAGYYACVDYVDDCIGRLLKGLRKAGCLENTYIVYTSDHGDMAGEHGLWWKRTYYEASACVPLLISGPDIPFGETQSIPVELVDLFPTCCDWAGIEVPKGINGESLSPLLKGNLGARHKKIARSELLGRNQPRFRMVRNERWKVVEFPDAPPRLFDLISDPGETRDLTGSSLAEAPFDELLAMIEQGGKWNALEKRENADRKRAGTHNCLSRGAVQYRINGRIIDADAHLYE